MRRQATPDDFAPSIPDNMFLITGIVTTISSLLMAALSLFVIPASCSVVAGLLLLFSVAFFLVGLVVTGIGVFKRRN